MKPNLEKLTKVGFKYVRVNYFYKTLEVYTLKDINENEISRIIYNRDTDKIVMQVNDCDKNKHDKNEIKTNS